LLAADVTDSFKLRPYCRITALVLVAAMFVIGVPLPAKAASDKAAAPQQRLAFDEPALLRPLLSQGTREWRPLSDHGTEPLIGPARGTHAKETASVFAAGAGVAQQSTGSGQQRRGVLFWTAVGASVGVGAGLICMAVEPDCRYPEHLCPLAPIMLGVTGATFGFMFGLGR
jgi:hypothetical protein